MKDLAKILKNKFWLPKIKQSCRSNKGGVLIETALTLPIFLVLVFMMIELMMFSYANLTSQYVVSKVMRDFTIHRITANDIDTEIEDGARRFGIIVARGDVSTFVSNHCTETNDPDERLKARMTDTDSNSYCLTNVSLFSACNKNGNQNHNDCINNNNQGWRYYSDSDFLVRDGDLYSLNWRFKFPMISWSLLFNYNDQNNNQENDNQGWMRYVTISASASGRLEPRRQ